MPLEPIHAHGLGESKRSEGWGAWCSTGQGARWTQPGGAAMSARGRRDEWM